MCWNSHLTCFHHKEENAVSKPPPWSLINRRYIIIALSRGECQTTLSLGTYPSTTLIRCHKVSYKDLCSWKQLYHLSNRSYTQMKTTHTTRLTDTIIYIPWQTKPLWVGFLRTLERVGWKRIWYEPTQLFLAQLGITYATGLRSCPKV